jgi:AcrR family transcriptional regulator
VRTATALLDPYEPIPVERNKLRGGVNRLKQRERRALILASTRKLIGERGCTEITVREIAQQSGLSPQTLYNLVGPRDQAIADALIEYSASVARIAVQEPSLHATTDIWLNVAERFPDFARQSTLMFVTPMQGVYLQYREFQVRSLSKLLNSYKTSGKLIFRGSATQLAEELIIYSSAMWLDWSIRQYPLAELRSKLVAGLKKLVRA